MKRKHEADSSSLSPSSQIPESSRKKPHLSSPSPSPSPSLSSSPSPSSPTSNNPPSPPETLPTLGCFRPDLFQPTTLSTYRSTYSTSTPYRHGVIPHLISPPLLASVRNEIITHISFTPKETDIYKIRQSGDLANLDGLDPAQLEHLPSLVKLRDALYSAEFRGVLEEVTGSGRLSGKKTDMAVNVYTEGCYLLCHDDVIGSRRVSFILYLTDPEVRWREEWGGGLRLYGTEMKGGSKVPMPEHAKVIPPSWGQLSFFAVQPGESFHDVEEVYYAEKGDGGEDGEGTKKERVRMAISGWYHIPQEGEDGYEEGLEQKLAGKSSLSQLQHKEADEFDEPRPQFMRFDEVHALKPSAEAEDDDDDDPTTLTVADLDFLLQYISPSYLTPSMTEQLASSFDDNSFLQLDHFLCEKFATTLREFITVREKESSDPDWRIARPPHKQRFLFQQLLPPSVPPAQTHPNTPPPSFSSSSSSSSPPSTTPISQILTTLFPSRPFRKWLSLITNLTIDEDASFDLLARRFRRGKDYTLASGYGGAEPRLEFTLGCTVSGGWEPEGEMADADADTDAEEAADLQEGETVGVNGNNQLPDHATDKKPATNEKEAREYGGEEVYMAGDDDDDDDDVHDTSSPISPPSKSKAKAKPKSDPAVYKSANEEDDAVLFTDPPAWNRFGIVLRDAGTLRFVKYVSRAAEGDRWDIRGLVQCGGGGWGEGDADADADVEGDGGKEEEFKGFDSPARSIDKGGEGDEEEVTTEQEASTETHDSSSGDSSE